MSFSYNRNAYLFSLPAELLLHAAEALSSAVDREWAVRNVMISELDRDCVDSRLRRFVEDLNETGLDFLASELCFRGSLDRHGKASITCNSPVSHHSSTFFLTSFGGVDEQFVLLAADGLRLSSAAHLDLRRISDLRLVHLQTKNIPHFCPHFYLDFEGSLGKQLSVSLHCDQMLATLARRERNA